MSNNTTTNTLTEVAALVLAALLIIAGVVLLYTGKIDYANSVFFFISALGLFGFNSAWRAPSPMQQAQIATIAGQQSEVISQLAAKPQPSPVVNVQMPPTQAPAQEQPAQPQYPMPGMQQFMQPSPVGEQQSVFGQQVQQPFEPVTPAPEPVQLRPIPAQFGTLNTQTEFSSTMPHPQVTMQ